MKVLFLVPNWDAHDVRYTTASVHPPLSYPMEFSYVHPLLEKHVEPILIDANVRKLSWEEMTAEMEKASPDVVVTCTTPNYLFWRCPPLDLVVPTRVAEICRRLGSKLILIGPHGTTDPVGTLEETGADFLIRGEPEMALSAFLNSRLEDLTIVGLCFPGVNNGIAEQVDCHQLPLPHLDWLDGMNYQPHVWSLDTEQWLKEGGYGAAAVEFSRGCTYDCPFCLRDNFRKKFRKRKTDDVIQEIRMWKERGVRYFFFIDEIFNWPSKELDELLEKLKPEGVRFGCQARPDVMSFEMVDRFVEAGLCYIEYGVETLTKQVNVTLHKNVDKERLKKVIAYTYAKIGKANTVLGIINFNSTDVRTALDLTFDESENIWNPKVVRPYPGTYIGDRILEMYNVTERPYQFVLKYTWWLQVENLLPHLYPVAGVKERLLPYLKSKILDSPMDKSQRISYRLLKRLWGDLQRENERKAREKVSS